MCMLCVEWESGKLTNLEALKNAGEIMMYSEDEQEIAHIDGVVTKILEKEFPGNSNVLDVFSDDNEDNLTFGNYTDSDNDDLF